MDRYKKKWQKIDQKTFSLTSKTPEGRGGGGGFCGWGEGGNKFCF